MRTGSLMQIDGVLRPTPASAIGIWLTGPTPLAPFRTVNRVARCSVLRAVERAPAIIEKAAVLQGYARSSLWRYWKLWRGRRRARSKVALC